MTNRGLKGELQRQAQDVDRLPPSKDRNWTERELSQLSSFIVCHIDKFQTEQQRRESKVYAVLSKYIATRNINQCRNYVRKLFRKFKDYPSIVNFFKLSLPNFDERLKEESAIIQKIIFPLKTIEKEMQRKRQIKQIIRQNVSFEDQQLSLRQCSVEDQIKDQYFSSFKELRPTDIAYYEPQYDPKSKEEESKSDLIHFVQKERGSEQESGLSRGQPSFLEESHFRSGLEEQQYEESKAWKDCHQMFFAWALKATNLIEKYAIQPPYLQSCFS